MSTQYFFYGELEKIIQELSHPTQSPLACPVYIIFFFYFSQKTRLDILCQFPS